MKRTWSAVAVLSVGLALHFASGGVGQLGHSAGAAAPTKGVALGVLVSAPDMSVARAAHTATALADGRVLVAGGFVEKGSARGAEV